MTTHTGTCLCKSVTVTGHGGAGYSDACHCPMCRTQNGGGAFHIIHFADSVDVSGETMSWYDSSDYAERGFCTKCGTTIGWRMTGNENDFSVSLGLFDPAPARVQFRIFVDEAGDYVDVPNDVPHMTGPEAIEHFTKLMAEKEN